MSKLRHNIEMIYLFDKHCCYHPKRIPVDNDTQNQTNQSLHKNLLLLRQYFHTDFLYKDPRSYFDMDSLSMDFQ